MTAASLRSPPPTLPTEQEAKLAREKQPPACRLHWPRRLGATESYRRKSGDRRASVRPADAGRHPRPDGGGQRRDHRAVPRRANDSAGGRFSQCVPAASGRPARTQRVGLSQGWLLTAGILFSQGLGPRATSSALFVRVERRKAPDQPAAQAEEPWSWVTRARRGLPPPSTMPAYSIRRPSRSAAARCPDGSFPRS